MLVTILYKTDFNHSFNSRDILGVFTNRQKLISEANKIIKKDLTDNYEAEGKTELKEYIKWNQDFLFSGQNQTQGLSSFELVIEEVESNKII